MENRKVRHISPAPLVCSYRLLLALVGCLAFINLYALRVNISVAMVCMVNHTHLALEASSGASHGNYDNSNSTSSLLEKEEDICVNRMGNSSKLDGEYLWEKKTQGIILGSFFWGYMLTQVIGGVFAERFGGKHVLGWSMFVTMVATFFTPVAASASPYLVIALRVIMGLGEGVVFPAMNTIWAKWAPPLERSKLIGFTFAGAQIGNVITLPVSGLLCDYGFAGGWPSIFYVFGIFCFAWFVLWMILVSDSPAEHRFITHTERHYIETSIGDTSDRSKRRGSTPWRSIFTSPAVWAIIAAHTCANWGTYTMLTNIPTYMREVLKFDIKQNGALSAIPYIAFWVFINIGGNVADALRSRGWRTVIVRKMSVCAGLAIYILLEGHMHHSHYRMLLPGLFLIITGYVDCSKPYVAVALLTLGIGLSGFQYSGQLVNHVDIAPPFAGTLFGISNTCATLPGILAPYFVAVLTPNRSQEEWQIVFYIAAAIYTVGTIGYLIFGQGELQQWAKPFMVDSGAQEHALESHREESKDLLSKV